MLCWGNSISGTTEHPKLPSIRSTHTKSQGEICLKSITETQVTAMSVQQDWVMGEAALTHRYATPTNKGTPWYAQLVGYAPTSLCMCRVSPKPQIRNPEP
jgi:hypothetical protein